MLCPINKTERPDFLTLEMNRFFGEDQSLGHVVVVISLLAHFIDAFAQSKSKFTRKQKSREKVIQKEKEKALLSQQSKLVTGANKSEMNDENDLNKITQHRCDEEKETLIL